MQNIKMNTLTPTSKLCSILVLHMYHSGVFSLEYGVYMNITLLSLLPIKSSFSVLKLCKTFDSVSPSTSYTHTHTHHHFFSLEKLD